MDSYVPSSKACTSSGRRRPCTRLWATRPPSPLSQTHAQAFTGSGLPSNWNFSCHACTACEEDTTLTPTCICDSWMIIPLDGRRGLWVVASPRTVEVFSATRCLFRFAQFGEEVEEVSDLGPGVVAAKRSASPRARTDQWSWSSESPCLHHGHIQYQERW